MMKPWFYLIMLAGSALLAADDKPEARSMENDAKPKAVIIKAEDTISVDGDLTESTWKKANTYQIDWIFGGKGNGGMSTAPRGNVQYAWDDNYFYIAYTVNDINLVTIPSGMAQGPRTNRRQGLEKYHKSIPLDFTMILLSLNDPNFFWEINHNASNNFDEARITLPKKEWPLYNSTLAGKDKIVEEWAVFFKDHNAINWDTGEKQLFTLKSAVKLMKESTVSHVETAVDKDKGFTAEIRIPWFALGAPLSKQDGFKFNMDGEVIRVLLMLRNGDLPGIYHSSAKLNREFAHKQMENWQAFTLKKD